MTEYETLVAMAQQYASACLRSALAHQERDKGGFSEAQAKAWEDYDEANTKLGRIITSYPNHETIISRNRADDSPTEHDSPARLEQVNELPSDEY